MSKQIYLLYAFFLIVSFGYGQNDSIKKAEQIKKEEITRKVNDSVAKLSDTLTTKEVKKKRKRIIKYQKISSYNDTLILINNDIMVGEFKHMDKSVITFKTKYSENDFKIKWYRVKEIHSNRSFIISLSDGSRHTGSISSVKGKERKLNIESGNLSFEEGLDQIVFLEPIGKNFLSRLTVEMDLGITVTKANNLRQLTSSVTAKYLANKWRANGSFKNVFSKQDEIEDIKRMDADIGAMYFLPNDWYTQLVAIYLSNDEQKLELRSTYRGGMGYLFIHSSNMHLGAMGGLAYTTESYVSDAGDRNSTEAYLGVSFNKYDIGDLRLLTTLVVYPSLSESGRFRTDFNFDMKYDLPLDFYIKMNLTYNYDNKPVEGASDQDYVYTTSFGWEFN